ncbi:MAG: ribose-phosphate pyrophosphokinase [Acidobacteria bacterium]|nr:ribose-phosphate pyrophosphokinase [Acidobacteriota bacterium]MBI1983216.1 ribose-phosphate pyrophosphokinase [Acidobacteriota bacterium]
MTERNRHALKVLTGNAHQSLAREICGNLGVRLGQAYVGRFPDGEVRLQILENVRGADVFMIQPTCQPVNDNMMELLIMLDALRRASAERITAVIPYYGYARQDRKDRPRVPISSKLIADLLTSAGADRVLALDLHAGQIQGYFNIPVDHLYAIPVTVGYFRKLKLKNVVVVSPDPGGVERARAFAKRLRAPLAIIDKRREDADVVEVMNVIGEVSGKICLIVDDMIDTGGTLLRGVNALLDKGARKVYACCTHGVFAGDAIARIQESPLEQVVTTNSIPLSPEGEKCPKIKVLSVAKLLADAIRSIHDETSVSKLFI